LYTFTLPYSVFISTEVLLSKDTTFPISVSVLGFSNEGNVKKPLLIMPIVIKIMKKNVKSFLLIKKRGIKTIGSKKGNFREKRDRRKEINITGNSFLKDLQLSNPL